MFEQLVMNLPILGRYHINQPIENEDLGKVKFLRKESKSISLSYPCEDAHICTPYVLEIKRGVYRFECWGSIGQSWDSLSKPGKGGYTSGTIYIERDSKFYVYIGTTGFFNAVKEMEEGVTGLHPGGATDVRLNKSDNWWDFESLKSRIMVAAGGGGAEWSASIGGNGGGLNGGESISAKTRNGTEIQEQRCPGSSQTSGSACDPLKAYIEGTPSFNSSIGEFGSAGKTTYVKTPNIPQDYGGFGGGGYYGGTSYEYSFAGSGGSSFISGHEGCNSIDSQSTETNITHTGDSIHYSRLHFSNTHMISGNASMPLPTSHSNNIHSETGAFRITLLLVSQTCSCSLNTYRYSLLFSIFIQYSSFHKHVHVHLIHIDIHFYFLSLFNTHLIKNTLFMS